MMAATIVFAWGSGSDGQLGLGDSADHAEPRPLDLGALQSPVALTTGGCHSAAVDATGALYMWGSNAHAQLHLDVPTAQAPVKIAIEPRVALVRCGWSHTVAVATHADGLSTVYSWGSNQHDQLGQTTTSDKAGLVQNPLRFLAPVLAVVSVASGWKHSLLATSDGRVFTWGYGRSGELGLGPKTLRAPTPTLVPIDGAVAAVYCGWQHSVFHLTSKGLVVVGSNRHGQLGLGNESRKQVFEPTPILEAASAALFCCDHVAVGWHHVLGVHDGAVYSWGKGSFGQLGHDSVNGEHTPRLLVMDERINHVACGSEHSLLVTASGRLYSCGWGEHGNLGHGDTQNVARPTPVAYFDKHRLHVLSAVAAGATSFAMATSQRA
ncbi:hypothetical protein SDRG_16112 [Saprolegnia diclina VS20]|uniref:RCC1-like domain-containing protein n=1 Tax=Saprolegnia diclina (strain VS20) TaxID=1156394 RepID=T0PUY4_SAPDV|nr:hypothetical protein SDRG_16112 [Saprolegnia diclina VS20]EQC26046.1 hypothetical protein SDRG_16112 [Saprolegnia diclina VS20]|eukprot:XP_008620531.1 hypothetical protein SDRG_16112 [Saprolegnia diclina VS20]